MTLWYVFYSNIHTTAYTPSYNALLLLRLCTGQMLIDSDPVAASCCSECMSASVCGVCVDGGAITQVIYIQKLL